MTRAEIEARYVGMFGSVPDNIRIRLDVAEATDRLPAMGALEAFREAFLDSNPLSPEVQRLVHFGLTLAGADSEVVESHARSAIKAGAKTAELVGVCETAAVVLGMPAYTRGIRAVAAAGLGQNDVRP